jgi:hypothetical protein
MDEKFAVVSQRRETRKEERKKSRVVNFFSWAARDETSRATAKRKSALIV